MFSARIRHSKLLIILAVLLSTLACAGFEKTFCTYWEGGEWVYYDPNPNIGGCCKTTDNDCPGAYQPKPWGTPAPESSLTEKPPTMFAPTQITSPQSDTSPPTTDNSQSVIGRWSGNAQWLCDDNPPCITTLDFKADGMVTLTCTYSGHPPAVVDTTWVLNDDNIQIQSETSPWVGTISGNTMQGNFVETRADYQCNGVWSVTKEE